MLTSIVFVSALCAAEADPPNIVLILTDDQGWGDLTSNGGPLDTPHIDSLKADGVSFERFYVSPVCAPTRASLLTGRYHLRCGVHGVTRGRENMRANELTIAEILKRHGYATGCFGKWHNGAHYPMDPVGQGFDEFVGFCAGHWNNYFNTTLRHDVRKPDGSAPSREIKTEGYITDVLTDHALRFIDEHKEQPFLCYVPYNAPHWPAQVPDKYWDRFKDRDDLDVKAKSAYAMVECIDDNVGRLLAGLEERGLTENTIVVFLTDNGANSNRWDGEMRGAKGSVHEGGIRVPCLVKYPQKARPGWVAKTPAQHCDLLPTLMELADLPMPDPGDHAGPLDGLSQAWQINPTLLGRQMVPMEIVERPPFMTTRWRRGTPMSSAKRSLFDGRYRATWEKSKAGWQLWDIQTDPSQTKPVKEPEAVEQLQAAWEAYEDELDPDSLKALPIPVGLPERPKVFLQGHEAFLHRADGRETEGRQEGDGISYHGPNGWANDWVDHWTSTEAYPFWNVDATAGTYAVEIKYMLHPADLGERDTGVPVRVVSIASAAATTLEKAFWFAPVHSPDRFPRTETQEQQWKTIPAGRLKLVDGVQQIQIRLDDLPGKRGPRVLGLGLRKL